MTRRMARATLVAAVLGSALLAGCRGESSPDGALEAAPQALEGQSTPPAAPATRSLLVAQLTGAEEVPPHATPAEGVAMFTVNSAGTEIDYTLTVANIRNITAAHIHLGACGVNGPVVAFLAGPFPPGGDLIGGLQGDPLSGFLDAPFNGVLSSGRITAADLVGPLAGRPLSDLIAAMRSGNAYVNVHTDNGVPPADTGPGDFPNGEIRGQIGRPCDCH